MIRLTRVQNSVTESYSYGDNNQLLTAGSKSYAYDANGNLTSVTVGTDVTTLAWDYNDKLTGITYPNSSTNSFTTNDLGHRVGLTDSGGSTSYLFDGSRVLADSRADYTNGGVTGLISERVGSTSKVYHGDQLGSTRGLSDGSEAITDSREYDAWGLTIASAGSGSPFGFVGGQGYQKDPDSGLMLLGARYYDPSVGRFISRDPIGYQGGLNLYGYCGNDPLYWTDSAGHSKDDEKLFQDKEIRKHLDRLKDRFDKGGGPNSVNEDGFWIVRDDVGKISVVPLDIIESGKKFIVYEHSKIPTDVIGIVHTHVSNKEINIQGPSGSDVKDLKRIEDDTEKSIRGYIFHLHSMEVYAYSSTSTAKKDGDFSDWKDKFKLAR